MCDKCDYKSETAEMVKQHISRVTMKEVTKPQKNGHAQKKQTDKKANW